MGLENNSQAETFNRLINESVNECFIKKMLYYNLKLNEIKVFKEKFLAFTDLEKVNFIVDAIQQIEKYHKGRKTYTSNDPELLKAYLREAIIKHFFKMKLEISDDQISLLVSTFCTCKKYDSSNSVLQWPVGMLITQIEKQLKNRKATTQLIDAISFLKNNIETADRYNEIKEKILLVEKINGLLFKTSGGDEQIKPTNFLGNDELGKFVNETIDSFSPEEKTNWYQLIAICQKASGAKPSKKYLEQGTNLYKNISAEKFKKTVNSWLEFIIKTKEKEIQHVQEYNGRTYTNVYYEFLTPVNLDAIKGFVWLYINFYDKATLFLIASLAERSYRKIPGKGPAAAGLGNACLYVLSESRGLDGIGHLSRLKLRIKQNSTRKAINKYLIEAAIKLGVSLAEIEDMAADDFGLSDGTFQLDFENFKAEVKLTGIGKTSLTWLKEDGSPQKSVPTLIKEKYDAKLKKLKGTIKQIEVSSTAQRDRIDRMLKIDRKLSWSQFEEFYFSHGLISYITKKLIWTFSDKDLEFDGIWLNNRWSDNQGNEITFDVATVTISLWHPAKSTVANIKNWREFMEKHQLSQPIKQAYREVYLLTDAEINTKSYSNRMAAHILKQHQFNSLANIRGWKYTLLGAYDNGMFNQAASIEIPEFNLKAEFWVNEVNADDAFNDTGIWNYISTDQVRCSSLKDNAVVDMVDIPKVVFSEIMRDVDLFVGVASVGNDPTWSDSGGVPAYRDYWQSYSFGDLSEVAKTRKEILMKLLPKLKIASVSSIQDKFLVVKGKLRTYKIHIGSTNILMEPNDQYLCIVPDRSKPMFDNLFIPFEGDNGLSIIISKALLLFDDDKITDTTITSQINRK